MSRDLGPLWHGIAGIALGSLAIFGFGREVLQHDWTLSAWQFAEAAAWPLGGLLAIALGSLVLKRIKGNRK